MKQLLIIYNYGNGSGQAGQSPEMRYQALFVIQQPALLNQMVECKSAFYMDQ
jgi:hypothetical protein